MLIRRLTSQVRPAANAARRIPAPVTPHCARPRGIATRIRGSERGQILVIASLLLPLLLGMAALAVDLGSYASARRQLQNAADSIALAAAQDLPNASAAQATAQSWAAKNGVDWANVTFTITQVGGANPNPKVSVTVTKAHAFAFIGALGVGSKNVGAHSAAIKTSPGGTADLMPWSVLQSAQQGATPGQSVTLKYDANNPTNGNFGAVSYDGTGASTYTTTIDQGSSSVVCAQGVTTCTTVSPQCSGSSCPTQTGNMTGPTKSGVDYRIANTDPSCSTFAQVFSGPVNGKYQINKQCDPWLAGSKPSLRVILVPVISSLCNGHCNVTVVGFALFFLEGYGAGGCTGNSCDIQGRFVNADLTIDALTGVYDPNSSIHFTKLSE